MRGWLVASLLSAAFALSSARGDTTSDQKNDACQGSPADAVLTLPAPLSIWGRLVCTPYGHVITANKGWIWTPPGAFVPVFVPAQMIREKLATVGNDAYFTTITMTVAEGDEAALPLQAIQTIFGSMQPPRETYRLQLISNDGRAFRLYFLLADTLTGIWCIEACDPKTFFMVMGPRDPSK